MNKKFLSAAVLAIIILALFSTGALVLQGKARPQVKNLPAARVSPSPDSQNTATSSSEVDRVEINYTEKGFAPAAVTVKKGTIIVFINKAAKGAMLVEAISPSTFTQPGASEVYSFIPNNAGTWNYRNRLNATASGTITAQ